MSSKVISQPFPHSKRFVAHIALMRFFSSMNSNMNFQNGRFAKLFTTKTTLMIFLPIVDSTFTIGFVAWDQFLKYWVYSVVNILRG